MTGRTSRCSSSKRKAQSAERKTPNALGLVLYALRFALLFVPYPLALAVGPALFFPDRRHLLDPVHDLLGRREGLVAVRRGHDDQHRRRADLQAADPVMDGDRARAPLRAGLLGELPQHTHG